jgi:hypothetical protein
MPVAQVLRSPQHIAREKGRSYQLRPFSLSPRISDDAVILAGVLAAPAAQCQRHPPQRRLALDYI